MKLSTAHYAAKRSLFDSPRTGRWQARKPQPSQPLRSSDDYSFANGFPWGKPDE
jgi:hypothetical protein